jgi:hypothetical protein
MQRMTAAILTAMALCLAQPAMAQTPESKPDRDAEEMAREAGRAAGEALSRLLSTLEFFAKTAPWYEPPEVLENGDIIIRRKRPPKESDKPSPPADKESDDTRT